jgi:DNA-binding NarL/FixJ family response regulator
MSDGIKLLVVDDHNLFRRGLIGLVREQPDFSIVGEAGNGVEAVDICRKEQPDVVLMDLHMPGGNGVDAVRKIKREMTTRILILTISNKDQDLFAALAAGADGYLLKDTEPPQLIQAIRQVATGQGVLSPEITARVIQAAATSHDQQSTIGLSPREQAILAQVAQGATTGEIALTLNISPNTVKTHIRRTLVKLEAANRSEAVARASALGLISPVDQ